MVDHRPPVAAAPPRPIAIGEIVRNANIFGRNFGTARMNDAATLPGDAARLFATLHARGIPFLLVGGIAMLQYVAGRNTEDVDLIVNPKDLPRIPEIQVTDRNEYFARGTFGHLSIDLLFTRNRLFRRVIEKYSARQRYAEAEIATATVEGLILLKLYALPSLYRQGALERVAIYEADVYTLLGKYQPEVPPLLNELDRHLSDTDMSEVRRILGEIEARIAHFRSRQADS